MESEFLPRPSHRRPGQTTPLTAPLTAALWLLDDDELLAETLLNCWQQRLNQLDQFPLQAGKDEASQLEGKQQKNHRQGNLLPFELRWFPTAQAALAELEKASSCIADQTGFLEQTAIPTLPLAIYVDGHLKSDSGELRQGAAFIRQLRAWCEGQSALCEEQKMERGLETAPLEDDPLEGAPFNYRPLIIAFSSDLDSNQAMLEAGADLAFEKQQYRQALEAALRALGAEETHGLATAR